MASSAFNRYAYPMPLWPDQWTPRLNSSRGPTLEQILRSPDAHPPVKDDVDAESQSIDGQERVQPRARLRAVPPVQHSRRKERRTFLIAVT